MLWTRATGFSLKILLFLFLLAQRVSNVFLVIYLSRDPLHLVGLGAQLGFLIWKAGCCQETVIFDLCSLCRYSLIFSK